MFDSLFNRQAVVARHLNAPHAPDRARFLVQCLDDGYSRSMLRKIAWQLLVVATTVDLRRHNVSVGEIVRAARRPTRVIRHRDASGASPPGTQRLFVSVATQWLRFLGRLEAEPANETAFTVFVGEFERHMRDERGLSPATIRTRCERVNWFLASLPGQRKR